MSGDDRSVHSSERVSAKYAAKRAATERIAAQRAAQARKERRRNIMVVGGSVLAVLAVVAAVIIVGVVTKSSHGAKANPVTPAAPSVLNALQAAAQRTSTTPDFSTIAGPPAKLDGQPLTSGGKPEVLYVGAEYCPHCGNTRWPLAIALSRFGQFSNLKTTYSSNSDSPAHIPTLSFYQSSYSSPYLVFVGKEEEDGLGRPLEQLTSAENSLFQSVGGLAYPFIDFAGKWAQKGDALQPTLLSGMTVDQVAKALEDPSSKQGKAILAAADIYTAIICEATGGQPTNVCSAPSVKAAEAALNGGK
ncbi:hypothetical protein Acel_2067 [Acidothermus cellulolyticus 11B]|uniref:Thioredoxin-like fold domain-containing protein n=1 Tax=Acidothermus cellulolyticus (strain ATCC 43068 / DSM 8971 / 11B) TaxID=351607 RepID=A0LWM9_ACIC1|nr:DUF929 family protein [Acidothermus cellulolyticus]ABK53839.1 hypothetical protein Acel_2067 [Acidothermus cellulolyticus 11B]